LFVTVILASVLAAIESSFGSKLMSIVLIDASVAPVSPPEVSPPVEACCPPVLGGVALVASVGAFATSVMRVGVRSTASGLFPQAVRSPPVVPTVVRATKRRRFKRFIRFRASLPSR